MTQADIARIFEHEAMKAADVGAFQKMLSRVRLKLKRRLDEIENEEEV